MTSVLSYADLRQVKVRQVTNVLDRGFRSPVGQGAGRRTM